jgi:hypothetical protein
MSMRPTALAVATVLAASWAVHLAVRPDYFFLESSSFDLLRVTALAVTIGLSAIAFAIVLSRRHVEVRTISWLLVLGLMVVVGSMRRPSVPSVLTVAATAAWLAAPMAAAMLVAASVARQPIRFHRLWTTSLTVAAAMALWAAIAARGSGLGATLGPLADESVSTTARLILLAHIAAWIVAGLAFTFTPDRLSVPLGIAAMFWLSTTLASAAHLLALKDFRDLYRGTYQPWSLVLTQYLPLFMTGALLVAQGWTLAVRPVMKRAESTHDQRDTDPLVALRDDLAAWTADPTLRLEYAAAEGWIADPTAPLAATDRYDTSTTIVLRDGQLVGRIEHDIALSDCPDVLRTAAELAGLAFDANHFMAASEERLRQVRALGERLLTADLDTRRSLAITLEAGPLTQLRHAAEVLRCGASLDEVAATIRSACGEVRLLSHGLYPSDLEAGGLSAVLPNRGVPRRRLDPPAEVTAFLLAHDDPEAWFEDRGSTLVVHRRRDLPSQLRDRISVLDGWIAAGNDPQEGWVTVELPCLDRTTN